MFQWCLFRARRESAWKTMENNGFEDSSKFP